MCVMVALFAVPAMAADFLIQSDGTGGIQPTFSMVVAPGNAIIGPGSGQAMVVGVNENLVGPLVSVVTNGAYHIAAKDNMLGSKTAGTGGKMVSFVTAYTGTALTTPIQLGLNGGTYMSMSATDATLKSSAVGEDTSGNLKIKQLVVVTDPILGAGFYQIPITITGGSGA